MDKTRKILSKAPAWIFTSCTVIIILWLTLVPDPLGDDAPRLFPGADKVVHGLMFGFLTLMILLDRQRRNDWMPITRAFAAFAAAASSLLGIAVEFAQFFMQMGRGFEVADMAADLTGSIICAAGWLLLQRHWLQS